MRIKLKEFQNMVRDGIEDRNRERDIAVVSDVLPTVVQEIGKLKKKLPKTTHILLDGCKLSLRNNDDSFHCLWFPHKIPKYSAKLATVFAELMDLWWPNRILVLEFKIGDKFVTVELLWPDGKKWVTMVDRARPKKGCMAFLSQT